LAGLCPAHELGHAPRRFDANATSLQVAGILNGDSKLLGQALDSDVIVEPVRGPLIPGLLAVKEAAKAAGRC